MLFLLLLFTQSLGARQLLASAPNKSCLRDSLEDLKTCAFDTCAAYTELTDVQTSLDECRSALGRKVVFVHRPNDETAGFVFGTTTPESSFEALRQSTAAHFKHDDDHTYDFTAEGVQVNADHAIDISVTDDETLANYIALTDSLGSVGSLTAEKVTLAPTGSPTEAPSEPILPNVTWPDNAKFWDEVGVAGFEAGVETWTNRNSYVPVQDCEGPPGGHGALVGDCSLHFTEAWGRMYGTNLDTNAYPWMCLGYFIRPEATAINMLVNIAGVGWSSIEFSWHHFDSRSVSYPLVGTFPVIADGNWNYDCYDLRLATGGKIIHEMIFHWPVDFEYPHPPAGDQRTEFWIDEVSFSDMDPTIEHRGSFLRNPTGPPTEAPTLPTVPLAIWTDNTQFFRLCDYEADICNWSSRNSFIPKRDCDYDDKFQGECVLHFDGYAWGRYITGDWNTATHPWFCTGYKIPAAADAINMLVNVAGVGWRSIEWTWKRWDDTGISYAKLGAFDAIVADGTWRHGCFNAGAITGNKIIHETIFHWPANHHYPYVPHADGGERSEFWLDDMTISDQEPTEYVGPVCKGC